MAVVAEHPAELLGPLLLVLALDDGALVHADADGQALGLAGLDDLPDLAAVLDVAGVEADLVHAGLDGLEGPAEMEVHVGHDGHRDLGQNLFERIGVGPARHGPRGPRRPRRRRAC